MDPLGLVDLKEKEVQQEQLEVLDLPDLMDKKVLRELKVHKVHKDKEDKQGALVSKVCQEIEVLQDPLGHLVRLERLAQ